MKPSLRTALVAAALVCALADSQAGVKVADLGRFAGVRDNALTGYGLVTGLAGTGDSQRSRATRQSIANMLAQFDVVVPKDQISSRNVAVVMVLGTLPAYARVGDRIDVTVTSIADARSLAGGTLLQIPLRSPDGLVRALAQGPLSIGGYRFDTFGNIQQKNHPTVGIVPGGATIEVAVAPPTLVEDNELTFLLAQPDMTTAVRIAGAINGARAMSAEVRDAGSVEVHVRPADRGPELPALVAQIENLEVEPGERARVVINERTGTVISGGDVHISRVTISHGDLKVSVTTDILLTQGLLPRYGVPPGFGQPVRQTNLDVDEAPGEGATFVQSSNTVADLIQTLNRIKTSPRDMIAILQGIKAAGALHAELIIQ